MNVLVIGSGGREHALAWKLSQARRADKIFVAPGNAGTASLGTNLGVKDDDIPGLVQAAIVNQIGLTIVGPEAPLAVGVVDAFRMAGLPVCGPTQAAARIESSKVWAKEFMKRHGIPTASFAVVETEAEAEAHLGQLSDAKVAVKADGLAAGKGVVMASGKQDALASVKAMLDGQFGKAGARVVLEETLVGVEVSVFAFVDGETVSNEVAACDYKRVGDGDAGPNTGGMGAYTPPEFWTPELARRIREEVLVPTARGMASEGVPFTGILYAGLMVTNEGPKVIEFNCRLGDPDGALVLPRMRSDLLEVCLAISEGRLSEMDVCWDDTCHVSVVMASGGYPGSYETGKTISGIDLAVPRALIFHASTALNSGGEIVTSGGRVLAALSSGRTFAEARKGAYAAVAKIEFEGAIYRSDIAARAESAATDSAIKLER